MSIFKTCPRCDTDLPSDATSCPCGWKSRVEPKTQQRELVPCAHMDCPTPAIANVKTPTGWANLCKDHLLQRHNEEARKWCHDRGLFTIEQKLAYIRSVLPAIRAKGLSPRIPGEDDA